MSRGKSKAEAGNSKAKQSVREVSKARSAGNSPRRTLVISHSHPELTKGGAEIAAYNQYLAIAESAPDTTWFLGCSRESNGQHVGSVFSQPFGDNEYVYASGPFDWFNFSNMDSRFPSAFRELLAELKPDEVHFHHYINIGIEAVLHVRETLPECRITLTLHEYLAICHHYGQMVTKPALTLCYGSSPRKCSNCFPDRAPEDFFLRKRYIDRFFDLVDEFISPSQFLAERYRQWGIASNRIRVRENIISVGPQVPLQAKKPRASHAPLRVGYFGQISKLKGIGVLLDAAQVLAESKDKRVVFEIYGSDDGQPPEFQTEFRERISKAGKNVIYFGPYAREQVSGLMAAVDVVLVPSIWWENSPLVILEALSVGTPVECSDIGGMAEKARNLAGVGSFPVSNAMALVSALQAHLTSAAAAPVSTTIDAVTIPIASAQAE
jgi:glycosyltransferase involved in cell wall biosynthesis